MSIKGQILQIVARESFRPRFIGLFTNPFYIPRRGLYQSISVLSHHISGEILDVGCGRKPYKKLFNYSKYTGLDIENPGHSHEQEDIDVFYDGLNFPFSNAQFDNALCNQVLEHVFEPDRFLSEINRVLKPGGCLLLTVPFVWDEHEQPNDFARYSSFGLKALLIRNGFEIIESKKSVNDIRVIFQLFICYIQKKTNTKSNLFNLVLTVFLISPINVLGELLKFILPENQDLYLDNVVLAKTKI